MILHVRPQAPAGKKAALVEAWYRHELKLAAAVLIEKWAPLIGVDVRGFCVRHMKTQWGSCSPALRTIRLNTDLAKKPRACLEYIVVDEMVHLLEPTHNVRFVSWMDRFMPRWRSHRAELNRWPVRHEGWINAHGRSHVLGSIRAAGNGLTRQNLATRNDAVIRLCTLPRPSAP